MVQTTVVSLIVIKSFLGLGGDVPSPFYWATKKSFDNGLLWRQNIYLALPIE